MFCSNKDYDCFEYSIEKILAFLSWQFECGASYGSLNTLRSLALLISPEIGTDHRIKRFFKGVFKLRPPQPKYKVTWDPAIVLNYLSTLFPNEDISLELLTQKIAALLALVTAHRVQTLSLIELQNIVILPSKIEIKIPSRIKTSGPNRYQPTLSFPLFNDKPQICTARAISCYLERTERFRIPSLDKLLITYKKPFRNATPQSISRWIKTILRKSGLDTSIFTAHKACCDLCNC